VKDSYLSSSSTDLTTPIPVAGMVWEHRDEHLQLVRSGVLMLVEVLEKSWHVIAAYGQPGEYWQYSRGGVALLPENSAIRPDPGHTLHWFDPRAARSTS
jgi:hypothetical protein